MTKDEISKAPQVVRDREAVSYGEAIARSFDLDLPKMDDAYWEARDREVADQRAKDTAVIERSRMSGRASELKDNGFPAMFVDAALAVPVDTKAMGHARMFMQLPRRILVLAGGVGAGKTTAATWIALKCQDPRPGFVRTSELERRGRYDKSLNTWLSEKTSLVIDDVGAEVLDGKGVFRSLLDEVVDMFYGDRKHLVLTTNLRPRKSSEQPKEGAEPEQEQFIERYGDRVWSRVQQIGVWGDCGIRDLRREIKQP